MKTIKIYNKKEPMSREYFSQIFDILKNSFPQAERRSFDAHFSEFENPEFRSMVLEDNDILGFMNYWELCGFIYLEHFAIIKEMRGKGLGALLMDELKKMSGKLPIILEVELPEISDIAERRVHFYERLGFILNSYKYLQPPYNDGEKPQPLAIMSYPKALSGDEFISVRSELYRRAYELPEDSDLFLSEI